MPLQAKKHLLKADADFISKILGVLQAFSFKGKPYLSYLQTRDKNDEFLMRDNIVKPLFVALGYHPQQDFSPEETIVSGRVDTVIVNSQQKPAIVLETQSSLLKDLSEHRKRLFTYTEEIGGRFAVLMSRLSNGSGWFYRVFCFHTIALVLAYLIAQLHFQE